MELTEKKEDRRVRRTRKLLTQALTHLLQEKQVNEITVRELTDLADAFGDGEHVGVCYDFGHANLTGSAFHRRNLNLIGKRLKAVHVQDNHGEWDEHLMPFFGSIDWEDA